jgi:IclR family transcriptional regulator, pca regulon regulatory protein
MMRSSNQAVSAMRMMAISLGRGSQVPPFCTSMSRLLLADQSDEEVTALPKDTELPQLTPRTITDLDALCTEPRARTRLGLVDQELELGLRSVALPSGNSRGTALAAMNESSHTLPVDFKTLREDLLPGSCRDGRTYQRPARPPLSSGPQARR